MKLRTKTTFIQNEQKFKKLVLSLDDKHDYIVYNRTLQLYEQIGVKIIRVNKVLQFRQQPYLKPYIDFNTECRKQAKTEFEKDFYCAIIGRFHLSIVCSFSTVVLTHIM